MAKRKTGRQSVIDRLADLEELAKKLNLPDGSFEGDIADDCREEADDKTRRLVAGPLLEQLEFLYDHGMQIGRIEELIREYAMSQD